jgi:hypothetical protein
MRFVNDRNPKPQRSSDLSRMRVPLTVQAAPLVAARKYWRIRTRYHRASELTK